MAAAWQLTIDMKLGIFRDDKPRSDPLAKTEGQVLHPDAPYVEPHNIWVKVRFSLDILCLKYTDTV
jgi:phosphatidylinositol 4-kinase